MKFAHTSRNAAALGLDRELLHFRRILLENFASASFLFYSLPLLTRIRRRSEGEKRGSGEGWRKGRGGRGGGGRKIAITGNGTGKNRLRRQDSVVIARPPGLMDNSRGKILGRFKDHQHPENLRKNPIVYPIVYIVKCFSGFFGFQL